MITVEAMRGYVLEEMLARLLRDNGYQLLVSPSQDRQALTSGPHGLLVHGRGADHQADVLGELTLPLPFSMPMRIFVEAKFRKDRSSLDDVRKAHGIVHDVNEYYSYKPRSRGWSLDSIRRYHYRYTLFSTSGFTLEAQRYALAQQISLVDLSNPDFRPFLDTVDQTARRITELTLSTESPDGHITRVRATLRHLLGTWPKEVRYTSAETAADEKGSMSDDHFAQDRRRTDSATNAEQGWVYEMPYIAALDQPHELTDDSLTATLSADRESGLSNFLVGFPAAPFILVLRAENAPTSPDTLTITTVQTSWCTSDSMSRARSAATWLSSLPTEANYSDFSSPFRMYWRTGSSEARAFRLNARWT